MCALTRAKIQFKDVYTHIYSTTILPDPPSISRLVPTFLSCPFSVVLYLPRSMNRLAFLGAGALFRRPSPEESVRRKWKEEAEQHHKREKAWLGYKLKAINDTRDVSFFFPCLGFRTLDLKTSPLDFLFTSTVCVCYSLGNMFRLSLMTRIFLPFAKGPYWNGISASGIAWLVAC